LKSQIPNIKDQLNHKLQINLKSQAPNLLPLQARPPAKPARHSPEAQPMADGQGEAARGTSGQVSNSKFQTGFLRAVGKAIVFCLGF